MTRPSLVVGPLPPPVDGRAAATAWLVDELRGRGCAADVIDTQLPHGWLRTASKAARCVRGALSMLVGPRRNLLLVASAGPGLLAELVPLATARLRRNPIYMAHHSSTYIRRRWSVMAWAVRIGGPRLRHVFLCEPMQSEFSSRYGIGSFGSLVLDNAALVPSHLDPSVPRSRSLVHISNLSREKGTLVAVEAAMAVGAPLVLAGPAAPEVRAAIASGMAAGLEVTYLGPVDSRVKARELSRARAFLFPSTYANEAQPLVIYEAASAGSIPVAWDVGWIGDQMHRLGLGRYVVPPGDLKSLIAAAEELLTMPDIDFHRISEQTMARFRELQHGASASIDDLARALQEPSPATDGASA